MSRNTRNEGTAIQQLEERARATLLGNIRSGYDPYYRRNFAYVRPSPGRYSWQWFWDSCFHAVSLARVAPEAAGQELRDLVASQDPDGFIGHVTYWGRFGALRSAFFGQAPPRMWRRRHSAMIQPPVLAQALERVYRLTGDRSLLGDVLPAAQRFYDWLWKVRQVGDSGLIFVVSPYETGLDNSPAYDEPLGLKEPTRMRALLANRWLDLRNLMSLPQRGRLAVIDVMMNSLLAEALLSLAALWQAAGDAQQADRNEARAARTSAALQERCWDGSRERYVHLWLDGAAESRSTQALDTARRLPTLTVASLFPLVLQTTPRERLDALVQRHLTNEAEFGLPYPVPSVARSEPAFDASGESLIWRGPCNTAVTWMLVRGLRRNGYAEQADHIAERCREMAERSGFREFYDPLTGQGLRGTNFGWGTIVVDMVA